MTVLAGVLCSLGGLIIVLNYQVVLRYVLWKKTSSLLPVLGGVLAAIGMYVYPDGVLRRWAWMPLILDIGCLPIVVAGVWVALRHARASRR